LTPTAEAIISVLSYCPQYGELGLIVGDPGVGKTTAIIHYVETTAHVKAIEISHLPTPAFGPALEILCYGLGIEPCAHDHVDERSRGLQNWFAEQWDGLDEVALDNWLERFGISALRFLPRDQAGRVIAALKSWKSRLAARAEREAS